MAAAARPATLARVAFGPEQPLGQAAPGPRAGVGRYAAKVAGIQAGATLIVFTSSLSSTMEIKQLKL